MLEISQGSLYSIPELAECPKIIVFDGMPPKSRRKATSEYMQRQAAYEQYKRNVVDLTHSHPNFQDAELVFCNEHLHLTLAIKEALKHVKTPFVFIHQHDFQLIKSFDVVNLLRTLEDSSNIKHVRLNRLSNRSNRYDRIHPCDELSYVPLLKTYSWSDNDHFSPVSYYQDFVFKHVQKKIPMEHILHRMMRQMVREDPKSHALFGTYIYGRDFEGPYIVHLDGKNWLDYEDNNY